MGWFDGSEHEDSYQQFQQGGFEKHEPSKVHELIAGAASFEAAKAYEDHVAANGPPPTHAMAKELLAGFAGAFIDREVETRGLDFVDREEVKYKARRHTESAYDERYNN